MNRADYSIEVKIIKLDQQKVFNLPVMCDDQVWFEVLAELDLGHSIEVPALNLKMESQTIPIIMYLVNFQSGQTNSFSPA